MELKSIIEAIDTWGFNEPDRIAYQNNENETYTFGELKQASDALAFYLEKEVGEGPIAVFGNLEFEMITAFLGAVKAGHAYLPIEANTPKERIEAIFEVAKPAMIISVADGLEETLAVPIMTKKELTRISK